MEGASKTNSDDSGAVAAIASLGDTANILPDTGGTSLLAGLAGVALVAGGGLLAYRKLRR